MLINKNLLLAVSDFNSHRQLIDSMTNAGFHVSVTAPDSVSIEIAVIKNSPCTIIIESDNLDFQTLEHLIKNLHFLENPLFIFTLYTYEDTLKNEKLLDSEVIKCIEIPYSSAGLCRTISEIISQSPIDSSKLNAEIDLKVTEMLGLFGFNSGMHGYGYIRDAVFIVAVSSEEHFNFSKDIYPQIARKFDTTVACIERSVRTTIKSTWETVSPSIKDLFFSSESLKNRHNPTNNEFIITIGRYIHNEYADFFERLDNQKNNHESVKPSNA